MLACIANLSLIPAELSTPETLKQLTIRLTDESINVIYNAIFAIKNIIELDRATLASFYQMGLLSLLVGVLRQIVNQPKGIAAKAFDAAYGLLLSVAEGVSFKQLREMEKMEEMAMCVQFAMEILEKGIISEVVLEFLATVAEYTGLRLIVQEKEAKTRAIERIVMEATGRIQCLACYLFLFSSLTPSEAALTEVVALFN